MDEAKKLEDQFLPRAREIEDPQILFPALAIGAQIDLALGDRPAALRLVEEFEHVTRRNPHFRTMHVHLAARACHGLQAADLGRRLLEGCSPIAARHQCCILTAEANVTEAEGGLEQALELYAAAAERWAEFGHVSEHGQALLSAGRCLLSLGRPTEAAAKLREAREVFLGLAASLLVHDVDTQLGQVASNL